MAAVYDDLILDHIRNARNYRVLSAANRQVSGSNPLCGDELTLYIGIKGSGIADIGFQCTCCGLSMTSASIMTELVNRKSKDEAEFLLQLFMGELGGTLRSGRTELDNGRRALLEATTRFPARARCVALPWNTLMTALAKTGSENRPGGPACAPA